MAFSIPHFNLHCNIWNDPDPTTGPPTLPDVECQLYFPKQDQLEVTPGSSASWRGPMYIRLPAGTDVRFNNPADPPSNHIECPSGTGRMYDVLYVDDAHKGFLNEYRIAVVQWHGTPTFPLP